MGKETTVPALSVEYAVAAMPLRGAAESGDHHLVIPTSYGTLIAVVDGVGHGPDASEAARVAIETMRSHSEQCVLSLVRLCHERMKHTRGAVMNLASLNDRDATMTWLGVGNVEGLLLRTPNESRIPDEVILKRGGLVGYHLPPLKALVVPVFIGDILIFATDGIHPAFAQSLLRSPTPKQMADSICSKHRTDADDALVLVARYVGRSA